MSTYEAIFVKLPNLSSEEMVNRTVACFSRANPRAMIHCIRVRAGNPWCQVDCFGLMGEDGHLAAKHASAVLQTDAIGLYEESCSCSIGYWHYRHGKELRALQRSESWWDVHGEPEEWERAILFKDEKLIEYVRDLAPSDAERIRRVHEAKRIEQGVRYPYCGSVADIGEFYGFPGFVQNYLGQPMPGYWEIERAVDLG